MLSCTMVHLLKDLIMTENADGEKLTTCKVLKASRLKRGEVGLCANEDVYAGSHQEAVICSNLCSHLISHKGET